MLLGIFMPWGLDRLKETSPALAPWAWGINGIFSVLAPVVSVAFAMSWGSGALMLTAIPAYLAAAFALDRDPAVRPRLALGRGPDAAGQRGDADAQPLGGGGAVSPRVAHGAGDRLFLGPRGGAARDLGQGPRQVEHVAQRRAAGAAVAEAQVLGADLAAVAQDGRPLQAVLQLADVAGPASARAAPARAASPSRRLFRPISRAYFSRKASARRRMSPRRRRRGGISTGKTDSRKYRSSRNCFAATASCEVAVGGRHHAHVHGDGLRAAHAVELLLLDQAQDLALQRQRAGRRSRPGTACRGAPSRPGRSCGCPRR